MLKNKTTGFTLIEIIVTISILFSLIVVISTFWTSSFKLQSIATNKLSMIDDSRKLLKPILNEIRSSVPSEQGAYNIESAQTSQLIFFSDVDSDGVVERVRYYLDSGIVKRGLVEPTGSPLIYNNLTEQSKNMIDNVSDLEFTYYNENYQGSGQEGVLADSFSVSDIRMIKISVTVDDDLNRPPNPVGIVESSVAVRNLKDNL